MHLLKVILQVIKIRLGEVVHSGVRKVLRFVQFDLEVERAMGRKVAGLALGKDVEVGVVLGRD